MLGLVAQSSCWLNGLDADLFTCIGFTGLVWCKWYEMAGFGIGGLLSDLV